MIKQLRFMFSASFFVALCGVSGVASATTCPSAISSYNSCSGSPAQIASCQEQIRGFHPECFGASSNTAAGTKAVQATSLEQILAISASVNNRTTTLSGPPGVADSGDRKGLAAGNASGKWNVWASVAESTNKYDRGAFNFSSFAGSGDVAADVRTNKFDNRIDNIVLGGDFQSAPNLAFGLSAAFDRGTGSASSYKNVADASKSLSSSGYSFAPYLGWQINKDWALDAAIGWGKGKNTVASTVKTDSKRFFYGTNVNYTKWQGNWQLTGKGGYLFGQEKSDDSKDSALGVLANTKVTNEVGQFRLSGQVAYWMNGVMPYFGLAYASDQRSTNASTQQQYSTEMGKSAWVWSLGANFISIKNAMTGGIGYEQETGRSRSKNNKLAANINVRF